MQQHIIPFLEYCEVEKGLTPKTIENYQRFLQKFTDWLAKHRLSDLKPHEITDDHIWKYRLYLSRHVQKTTQVRYLVALRNLLTYFTGKNIASFPVERIQLPKLPKVRLIKFLTLEQIEKLLLAANDPSLIGLRDRAILEILFSTGMRVSELVGLNRDHLDWDKLKRPQEGLELAIKGKGGHPRTVYLSPRALRWLKRCLDRREDVELPLFINYRSRKDAASRRLTIRSIEKIVRKYAKIVGLPSLATPHTLRHSYATDLLAQGVDLRSIQEFLGHQNVATTQVYTHVTQQHLKRLHRKYHSGQRLKE